MNVDQDLPALRLLLTVQKIPATDFVVATVSLPGTKENGLARRVVVEVEREVSSNPGANTLSRKSSGYEQHRSFSCY